MNLVFGMYCLTVKEVYYITESEIILHSERVVFNLVLQYSIPSRKNKPLR